MRDSLTNVSRGFAVIEFASLEQAQALFTILCSKSLVIDFKRILVNYSKNPFQTVASGESTPTATTTSSSSHHHNHNHHHHHHQRTPMGSFAPAVAPNNLATAAVLASAAMAQAQSWPVALGLVPSFPLIQIPHAQTLPMLVAQQLQPTLVNVTSANTAHLQQQLQKQPPVDLKTLGEPMWDGSYQRFQTPDTNSFQFDDSSGFYYDPLTTLYYDANSQYFYNSVNSKYYFWSEDKMTYLPAPGNDDKKAEKSSAAASASKDASAEPNDAAAEDKKKEDAPAATGGKTKKAADIAKDMERWAKRQNKEKAKTAKQTINNAVAAAVASSSMQDSKTADAGFAALEKKMDASEDKAILEALQKQQQERAAAAAAASATAMIASYGGDSDDEEGVGGGGVGGEAAAAAVANDENPEEKYVDFAKMACLLCKRQFGSKDQLTKHVQLSDLHKENLRKVLPPPMTTPRPPPASTAGSGAGSGYRDRAQERREKFGAPEPPMAGKRGGGNQRPPPPAPPIPYQQPTVQGLGEDNKGNKLLKNMG